MRWIRNFFAELDEVGLLFPVLAMVAVLLGFFVYVHGRPRYLHWKSERAAGQARDFLRRNDRGNARLALKIAFQAEANATTYSLLADLLEEDNSDQAVEARRLAAQSAPDDFSLKLALVETALRFKDTLTAHAALFSCSAAEKAGVPYRRAAAASALIEGDFVTAETLLGTLELEVKGDAGIRLLCDAVRVHDQRRDRSEAARRDLQALAQNPGQRLAALRVLLADAFARRDPLAAREMGEALAAVPSASFSDWLDAAAAEKFAQPASGPEPALLEKIRSRAVSNPFAAVHYARWLLTQEGAKAAASWLDQLPPALADTPVLLAQKADIAAIRADWTAFRSLLSKGAWGPLVPACLDFAFTARLALRHGEKEIARQVWAQAVDEVRASAPALRGLSCLAAAWKWPDAMDDALILLVRQFPSDTEAFRRLTGDLRGRGDSRGLLKVLGGWRDAPSGFERQQQDWALLSLLIEPAAAPNTATRILETLHAKEPANAYYTTSWAFALWQLNRVHEACALVDGLSDAEKALPGRAPYLAVIYASSGRLDRARSALRQAPSSQILLPEEAALLAQADAMLSRKAPKN